MPRFRLTPLASRLTDVVWHQSAQRAVVVVEAVDERAARTQVSDQLGAWVEGVGAARSFWVSPWEDPYFVTCVQEEEAGTGGEDQGAEL